jgi:hypothetical protein
MIKTHLPLPLEEQISAHTIQRQSQKNGSSAAESKEDIQSDVRIRSIYHSGMYFETDSLQQNTATIVID